MVKSVRGILYKGFSDPLPNLDPERMLQFGSYDLIICRKCLDLYGRLVRVLPDSPAGIKRSGWRFQKCRCMKDEDKRNGKKCTLWPGNDYNTSVEFCYCCSKKLINSGSKYSSFFCTDCTKIITENNRNPDNIQIPYGRHSFMNGIRLGTPFTKKEEAQFNSALNHFFEKVDLLREWQKYSLFENLHDLGFRFNRDISLPYYDSLIKINEDDSQKKLNNMISFFMNEDYNNKYQS